MKFKIDLIEKSVEGAWFVLTGEKGGCKYSYPILVKDVERMSDEQVKNELQGELAIRFGLQSKWEGQEIEIDEKI